MQPQQQNSSAQVEGETRRNDVGRFLQEISPEIRQALVEAMRRAASQFIEHTEDHRNRVTEESVAQLCEELSVWVNDSSVQGNKAEAASRIEQAFIKNHDTLILDGLGLSELPSCLNKLTQLTQLSLINNQLDKLPEFIGSYPRLELLNVEGNRLSTLPDSMESLRELRNLCLNNNDFATIPRVIEKLPSLIGLSIEKNTIENMADIDFSRLNKLETLLLNNNKLNVLPEDIGKVTSLKYLILADNEIKELPASLGELTNLEDLVVSGNRELSKLPVNLGQLWTLKNIEADDTAIEKAEVEGILASCASVRQERYANELPGKIAEWMSFAGSKREVNLQNVSTAQKVMLFDWLNRLEDAAEFEHIKQEPARVVFDMLVDLTSDNYPTFKERFFNELQVNLENCSDRAAMTLNSLYTTWKLETVSSGQDTAMSLSVLADLSKTYALRDAVANKISENPDGGVGESVEIYLYYETALKSKLGLETAVNSMHYASFGKKDWIDEEELTSTVMNNYLDKMTTLVQVENLWKEDSLAKSQYEEAQESIYDLADALYDKFRNGEISDSDYTKESNALQVRMDGLKSKSMIDWIKTKI